jgi:hypothetical protein
MPLFSQPSINDDRGNPINLKKNPLEDLVSLKNIGQQKGKPDPELQTPAGFTDPSKFLISNNADELGVTIPVDRDPKSSKNSTNSKDKANQDYTASFNDPRDNDFRHGQDTSWSDKGGLKDRLIPDSGTSTKDIYLTSFLATSNTNEDPTMLGYDIHIDFDGSPLFNGAIEDFINQFTNTTEISSRLDIYNRFKFQFLSFFRSDITPAPAGSPLESVSDPIKAYYIKKITGMDKLNEANLSNDSKKSFVNYGEDFITLTLNEDVTQNMGYLSSLYKALSWSRINGKQVIPANLLRFNLILTVSEIRKYNRVIKFDRDDLRLYPDLISRYNYNLYECQLFFPKLPHGDSLDMSSPSLVESYEIQFNYKFSTLRFDKFKFDGTDIMTNYFIDNQFTNPNRVTPSNGNLSKVGSSIELRNKPYPLSQIISDPESTNSLTQNAAQKSTFKDNMKRLGGDLKRAAVREINRQIITQARLLNRTLDNIRNSIPLAGRMSAPTNVYEQDQLSLATDVQNSIRNFVGRSIKGFFQR